MILPEISLLVPCYNAAGYLPRLFASIRDLTVGFAEVLCYDDGSTDDTVAVAESFGARVIRGEGSGRGPSVGRNRLAKEASCEWIHFQDADDPLHPKFVERTMAVADSNVDVVAVDCDWLTESTRELALALRYHQAELDPDPIAYLLRHPMSALGAVYRRKTVLTVGGFDEKMRCWEDSDLNVRLAHSGARFHVLEEVVAFALRHDRGLSRDQRHCWECRVEFLERYATTLPASAHATIAEEAERAASALLTEGDRSTARRAVKLSARLGRPVPTTRNPLLRVARAVLPTLTALQAQQWARRWF